MREITQDLVLVCVAASISMSLRIIAFASLLLTVLAHDFNVCSGVADHMGTSSITLTPDPPLPGANFTTVTVGTPDQDITGGTVKVTVKALGITVKKETYDLCDLYACPVKAGTQSTSNIAAALAAATPHGVIAKNKVVTEDSAGNVLGCVEMDITIG